MVAYKLFRKRKDGTLGPLFINARLRVPIGEWLPAEEHRTKGFAFRPGWHAGKRPHAPHLSEKGRVWCKVQLRDAKPLTRPQSQGGEWLIAKWIKVIEEIG